MEFGDGGQCPPYKSYATSKVARLIAVGYAADYDTMRDEVNQIIQSFQEVPPATFQTVSVSPFRSR
jgi:hypothetical protein